MDSSSSAGRLLRAREAAEMLAISERKLWDLTNRNEIPVIRIGRSVRYDSHDLSHWIERHKTPQNNN